MRTQMAGLDVQVFEEERPRGAVVLCHGFGAPGDDLVPLYGELLRLRPELEGLRFYFPAAPLSLGGFGWGDSRAWWMIDMVTVQRLQESDQTALREFRRVEPQGMDAARKQLLKLVSDVSVETGLPYSKVVLGGFSQGAMLATDVALRLEEAPAGLVVMSGTLLIEDVWRAKAKARAGLKVVQSHGRQDPLLAYSTAEWLRELLADAGLLVDFLPFDGGHTITSEVLVKVADFISRRLP